MPGTEDGDAAADTGTTTSTTPPPDEEVTGAGATEETTTTIVAAAPSPTLEAPLPDGGVLETGAALQITYRSGLFGSVGGDGPLVLGAEVGADHRMVVEMVKASWPAFLGLAVVISLAILAGMDRRRSRGSEPA